MSKSAYLIVICSPQDNSILRAELWSNPEWEASLCLPNVRTYVAYSVSSDSFSSACKLLLQSIFLSNRYAYLRPYLEKDLEEYFSDSSLIKGWVL
jgi:hypothetical protein